MINTILFDFFGVISTPVYMQVFEHFLPDEDLAPWIAKLDLLDLGILPESELVSQIALTGKTTEMAVWNFANAAPATNTMLLEYIAESLKPEYAVGLFTNVHTLMLERIMKDALSLFTHVFTSSDLGHVKPDPKIYTAVIARLDTPPEHILFIDDSQKNITAAQAIGMYGIVFRDTRQAMRDIAAALK